jgi:DNA-binding MarR family transcriptional regulator
LKTKGYVAAPGVVNPGVDDDLQEFIQLFAQVVQAQKRGKGRPPSAFIEAIESGGLGPRHIRVLMSLTFAEAQSVSELAGRIGLSLGTTSLMVGELSKAGLVERSEDELDRRRTLVRIHREYVDTVRTLFRERTEPLRRALERMPERDRKAFMAGWRLMAEEAAREAESAEER